MDRATNIPVLTTERRDEALWLRMNRPEALNPIGTTTVRALDAELTRLIDTPVADRPTAVVITGSGRAFSAGGDLSELGDGSGQYRSGAPLFRAISATLRRMELLDLPVIAAVNGLCVAGGLEIALACDLVIAAENARFGDGHANFGLLPGGGGSVRLPRAIGAHKAKMMMMTGSLYPAEKMEAWGLVSRVVPAEELEASVTGLVRQLAAKSALGLARMKRLIDGGLDLGLEEALQQELRICEAHDASHDRNEGLTAFAQKRPPDFRGI